MKMKFEVFPNRKQWFFRIRNKEGQIVATSEPFDAKQDALDTIGEIRYEGHDSEIVFVGA